MIFFATLEHRSSTTSIQQRTGSYSLTILVRPYLAVSGFLLELTA